MNETVVTRSNLDRANWAKSLDKAIWGGALSRHFAGQRSGNQRLPWGRKNNARSGNPKASGPNIVVVVWNDMGFSDIGFLTSVATAAKLKLPIWIIWLQAELASSTFTTMPRPT